MKNYSTVLRCLIETIEVKEAIVITVFVLKLTLLHDSLQNPQEEGNLEIEDG